jgi:hypothetical protein
LIATPVAYSLFDDLFSRESWKNAGARVRSIMRRRRQGQEEAEATTFAGQTPASVVQPNGDGADSEVTLPSVERPATPAMSARADGNRAATASGNGRAAARTKDRRAGEEEEEQVEVGAGGD